MVIRIIAVLILVSVSQTLFTQTLFTQTVNVTGKPIAEIFTDFHLNLNDTSKTTGFALNRAHLGYKFTPDKNIYGTIIINVGKPEDLAPGSEPRRYAYFREASFSYTNNNNLVFTFGITGTRLFDFQQKFWGKRYIANTYQSINGYGFVADLGVVMDYRINELIKTDITIMNGEGYSNIQLDNSIKTSIGFTITPSDEVAVRIYSDLIRIKGVWQPMLLGFMGFKNEKVTIGAELTYKSNLDLIQKHHAWGISGTGALSISRKSEIFARFDYSTSVTVARETRPWNYLMDGRFIVVGFQHTFSDNIKIALDYQGTYPYSSENQISKMFFINALFNI